MFGIKVLQGVHAGAKGTLGDGRTVVGSAPDCDIVLAIDEVMAHHAALSVEGGTVTLIPLEGEIMRADGSLIAEPETLPPLTPFAVGSSIMAIGPSGAPWPRIDLSTFGRRILAEPEMQVQTASQAQEAAALPQKAGADKPVAVAASAQPAAKKERGALSVMGHFKLYPLVVLLAVGAGFVAFSTLSGGAGGDVPVVAEVQPVEEIVQRLQQMGLSEQVQVRAISNRVVMVSGYVADAAERALVEENLTLPGVQMVMRVWVQEDLLREARNRLAELADTVQVVDAGPGALRLTGHVADNSTRNRILATLREDVAGTRDVIDEIMTRSDLERQFREVLGKSPLSHRVRVEESQTGLVAHGALGKAELEQWQGLTQAFAEQYGGNLPIRTAFVPEVGKLPFFIRGVIAGPLPYIITDDGRRVMVGGTIADNYQLVAIEDGKVTIRNGEQLFEQRLTD
ncbi:type III secretion system inner membrane ring subunit SctD [Telmatospirillum sp. J64-1]|uniref:type III secretion system inner membrane ring subunit SctD n=1 Tax=Telmatospirillum sp. J64-1 TaxID=2502183 RepID=UPI00163DC3CC|nr:type III secretion system inner membrane ring subunit SctD [Telmatospirillum sp. J64-1]